MATAEQATSPASAPALTVTPASPTTASPSSTQNPAPTTTSDTNPALSANMTTHEKPTGSETALLASNEASSSAPAATSTEKKEAAGSSTTGRSSPLETLTRRLSGKTAPKTGTSNDVTADAVGSEKKPRSTAPATSTAPAASTSRAAPTASKPAAAASGVKAGQRKKKKRKGLAGLFVALGCLSAGEFEDEPKAKPAGRDMAQKPGQSVTKTPATATTTKTTAAAVPAGSKTGEAKGAAPADAAQTPAESSETGHRGETTNSTLVDDATKTQSDAGAVPKEALVVAPVEPVHVPIDETAGLTSSAVQPPGSGSELLQTTPRRPSATRRESETTPANVAGTSSSEMAQTDTSAGYTDVSESDIRAAEEAGGAADEHEYGMEEEYEDEEDRLIAQGGMGIPLDENGQPAPLLPPMSKEHHGRKCLVLDLDETLLHSSFKMLPTADYIVPVEIESQTHNVYVIKRPGVDHFLTEMGKIYEVVVFTASLSKYADPVLDMLDPKGVVKHRLFRESCYNHKGNYVKDLSQLGRDMEGCIIIDNSPASYIFHPNNAVPVSTWFNDPHDTELTDLCPFLTDLATVDDIRGVLDGSI